MILEIQGFEGREIVKVEIINVPEIEQVTDGLQLVQFYVTFNCLIPEVDRIRHELLKLLSHINYTLAIGSFQLNQTENYIYLKYNLALENGDASHLDIKITRVLWLINRHFDVYSELFLDIIDEKITYASAVDQNLIA